VAARNDLALSLALGGKYDEATDILAPIARSASATAADRQNLAFVYGMKGDHDAALALSRIDLSETASQANARFFTVAAQSSR
jgi:Flp pilus assembly protein TadD